MDEFWLNVLVDLVANLITWVILVLIAGFGLLIHARSRRASLFRFFGMDPVKPSISAYLTTVVVQPGGAKRVDGDVSQIWEGAAISANSLRDIVIIPSIFNSFTDKLPILIRRVLSTKRLSFEPITVDFRTSPPQVSEIAPGPILCLTGPGYNLATKYHLETGPSYIDFTRDHQFRIKRGGLTGNIIMPSGGKIPAGDGNVERFAHDLALVSRLNDTENHRKVVIAAGTGSNGTRASVEYLVNHWRDLDKKYGSDDFAIILECPNRRKDIQGYKLAKVVQILPNIK
jgi:hypothetical protein